MQAYVHGSSLQAWLVGVIVPEPETFIPWITKNVPELSGRTLKEMCANDKVKALVLADLTAIARADKLHGFEFIKAVYLESEPFTIENDLLSPTFKIKRNVAAKRYEQQINQMYVQLAGTSKSSRPSKL